MKIVSFFSLVLTLLDFITVLFEEITAIDFSDLLQDLYS